MWSTPIKTSFTEDERLPLFLSQLIPEDSFVVAVYVCYIRGYYVVYKTGYIDYTLFGISHSVYLYADKA